MDIFIKLYLTYKVLKLSFSTLNVIMVNKKMTATALKPILLRSKSVVMDAMYNGPKILKATFNKQKLYA